jgi:hypothetical protein
MTSLEIIYFIAFAFFACLFVIIANWSVKKETNVEDLNNLSLDQLISFLSINKNKLSIREGNETVLRILIKMNNILKGE